MLHFSIIYPQGINKKISFNLMLRADKPKPVALVSFTEGGGERQLRRGPALRSTATRLSLKTPHCRFGASAMAIWF